MWLYLYTRDCIYIHVTELSGRPPVYCVCYPLFDISYCGPVRILNFVTLPTQKSDIFVPVCTNENPFTHVHHVAPAKRPSLLCLQLIFLSPLLRHPRKPFTLLHYIFLIVQLQFICISMSEPLMWYYCAGCTVVTDYNQKVLQKLWHGGKVSVCS